MMVQLIISYFNLVSLFLCNMRIQQCKHHVLATTHRTNYVSRRYIFVNANILQLPPNQTSSMETTFIFSDSSRIVCEIIQKQFREASFCETSFKCTFYVLFSLLNHLISLTI